MKRFARFLSYGLPLLLGAAAGAYLLAGAAIRSDAVQNPTISLDMVITDNTYTDPSNTPPPPVNVMTVGSISASSSSAAPTTHYHQTHLVIRNVEDLVAFQMRLHYIGDKMRPQAFNPAPFLDNAAGQDVGFLNLPIDPAISAHRTVTPANSIPLAPPDGSNTPQTALVGASYDGAQTLPISPDTPHKPIPDDASYDAPSGGVLGNLQLQILGNECGSTMTMDLDDGVPNAPGSGATIFTGSGTTTISFGESQLFDGTHSETCPALDSDQDGWSDNAEGVIGTDPFDGCADNSADAAWPPDIDNNTFSDISDIAALTGVFGGAVPAEAPARYNIAPDQPDGFVDITDVSRLTGLFGAGCN